MDNDELQSAGLLDGISEGEKANLVRRAQSPQAEAENRHSKRKYSHDSPQTESLQDDLQLGSVVSTKRGVDDDISMPPTSKQKLRNSHCFPPSNSYDTKSKYGWTEVAYEDLPSMMQVSSRFDPFKELADQWSAPDLHRTLITMTNSDGSVNEDLSVSMILPKLVALPPIITLFWEDNVVLTANFGSSIPIGEVTPEDLTVMRRITAKYLQATATRMQGSERDFVVLFIPNIELTELENWANEFDAVEKAVDVFARDPVSPPIGILRDGAQYSEPRIFNRWIATNKPNGDTLIEIACEQLPKRRNYLHKDTPGHVRAAVKKYIIPASACTVDTLPVSQAIFGRFISPILDRIQANMVAAKLNDNLLKEVGIQNLAHVITAITAPTALAQTDYQKLEFYGDSVLKYTVACQQFLQRETWTEGELSESRDAIVNNKRLAYAAMDTALHQFILTDRFTPKKWEPPLISTKLVAVPKKETFSLKVMADAVEALIGAALVDGGMKRAQACLTCFLPDVGVLDGSFPIRRTFEYSKPALHDLIGYEFHDGYLLEEALTHGSLRGIKPTYERLEWLGDAVLDSVVLETFRSCPDSIPQGHMTMLKHATVNANLLGFCCMEFGFDETTGRNSHNLMSYFNFMGDHIHLAITSCWKRFYALHDEIKAEIENSDQYPWALLARLHCDKIFSDITESIIGAIFVDSGGSIDACRPFLEKIGLLTYLRRFLSDNVKVEHPRNQVQSVFKHVGTLVFKHSRVQKKASKRKLAFVNEAEYTCTASIGKHIHLGKVEGCISGEEADLKLAGIILQDHAKGHYDQILNQHK